jgi:hypothetical protein
MPHHHHVLDGAETQRALRARLRASGKIVGVPTVHEEVLDMDSLAAPALPEAALEALADEYGISAAAALGAPLPVLVALRLVW